MTKINIPFSLYIMCTDHEEYEKQFLKTEKVLSDFKQLKSLFDIEGFDITKLSTVTRK